MQDREGKEKGMSKLTDRISHLIDDWETHSDSFRRTGFWGAFGGAGAIFLARDTGRLLLTQRSSRVLQPGTPVTTTKPTLAASAWTGAKTS